MPKFKKLFKNIIIPILILVSGELFLQFVNEPKNVFIYDIMKIIPVSLNDGIMADQVIENHLEIKCKRGVIEGDTLFLTHKKPLTYYDAYFSDDSKRKQYDPSRLFPCDNGIKYIAYLNKGTYPIPIIVILASDSLMPVSDLQIEKNINKTSFIPSDKAKKNKWIWQRIVILLCAGIWVLWIFFNPTGKHHLQLGFLFSKNLNEKKEVDPVDKNKPDYTDLLFEPPGKHEKNKK